MVCGISHQLTGLAPETGDLPNERGYIEYWYS